MRYKERQLLNGNKKTPVLLILMSLSMLSGCVTSELTQYRDQHPDTPCINASNFCGNQDFIQGNNGYLLGIIEFDDQGSFWSREKSLGLLERIERNSTGEELLIVIYTHGWRHNAHSEDDNFMKFRLSLSKLQDQENTLIEKNPRTVVGLYLAWRGNSFPVEGLNYATFWDRKNTSHEIGTGAIVEALVAIEHLYQKRKNDYGKNTETALVTMGHSFGAAVLYSALSHTLIERFYLEDEESGTHKPSPYGDLVILVNPAFEAQRFDHLYRISNIHKDSGISGVLHNDLKHPFLGQLPILAIFTAKNDWATSTSFKYGRYVNTIFEKHRDSVNQGDDGYNQWGKDNTAVGHYENFISHYLCLIDSPDCYSVVRDNGSCIEQKPPAFETISRDEDKAIQRKLLLNDYVMNWRENCWSGLYGRAVLSQLGKEAHSPNNPYIVAKVEKKLIDGHGGIWGDDFRNFIGEFILAILANREKSMTGD